jgi:lipoyl(octanoyl) transferase
MNAPDLIFKDLGMIRYQEAWDFQEKLFNEVIKVKLANKKRSPGEQDKNRAYLLFCEHPHVFTIGKSGSMSNLLLNEAGLKEKGVEFFPINRGGDITYHGPGQIVGYPILDLEVLKVGIKKYIHLLEDSVILTLKEFGIEAGRLQGATGVWLDTDNDRITRKICAIGIRTSRWVTMHGFAFNINTDLDYYRYINPCGFIDKGVTSLQKELGHQVDMQQAKDILKRNLESLL